MQRCTAADASTLVIVLLACAGLNWIALKHVCAEEQRAQELGVPRAASDIDWNSSRKYALVGLGFVAGVLASWLGMGGGSIYSPILLNFGVHPQVVSATSMFIVMIVTFSSVMLFFVAGLLELTYGGVLAVVAVGITYVSVAQITRLV